MNGEKQNQTYYQETFCEVHAPQGLTERLMNMDELKSRKKVGFAAKWLAVAAATAVFLFAGSNCVAYAMTGSTWVENLVYKITLDGVEYDVDMEGRRRGDGNMQYAGSIQHENGDVTEIKYEEFGTSYTESIHTKKSAGVSLKDGRVRIIDGDVEIDVTEELLEKGMVSGSYERNGHTKIYKITKEGECITPYIVTVETDVEEAWKELEVLMRASEKQPGRIVAEPTPTPAL